MASTDIAPRTLAWIELNILNITGALPLEGVRLYDEPTHVYDLNGELLFERFAFDGPQGPGFADVAADSRVGATLIAAAPSGEWNEKALLEAATAALREQRQPEFETARIVAYSYPKLAVQFLRGDTEVALLELFSWQPVPPARKREKGEPPANFDRWSFLDELDARAARTRSARFDKRVAELAPLLERLGRRDFVVVETSALDVLDISSILNDTRQLHYSKNNASHQPCYELHGQQTNVWCVAASVQMLLEFYRYEYAQTRIATELDLGTLANPNGLPYAHVTWVVTTIEKLTSKALDATMNTSPTWSQFRSEIQANRPMISFIPGHSRTIAGYTRSGILTLSPFRGLLVYDPWPPNAGVITKWENFDAQTYTHAYTALVTLV
jgi:hypothetical protein